MKLQIKVIPSSSKDCIVGWLGGMLTIKVKPPPDKGKANKAVINVVEKSLVLLKGTVQIESGLSSSKKIITISSYTDHETTSKLNAIIEPEPLE